MSGTYFPPQRVPSSYLTSVVYRNRQDAIEAIDIAARGKVKVVFKTHGLSALKETYEALEAGTVAGRIVLNF